MVVHGGVKFDPYREAFQEHPRPAGIRLQETYPCSEGFIAFGDPATGLSGCCSTTASSTSSSRSTSSIRSRPDAALAGHVEPGVNYAIVVSTCAGMWAHIIGDTVRFESLDPPLLDVHRPDQVHALGLRRAPDQRGGRGGDGSGLGSLRERRCATGTSGRSSRGRWAITSTSSSSSKRPADPDRFRRLLDADLSRRNADYLAHRAEGVGLPLPALLVAQAGGFDAWMRSRASSAARTRSPGWTASGTLTDELVGFLRQNRPGALEIWTRASGATSPSSEPDQSAQPPASSRRPAWRSGRPNRGARRPPRGPRR